MFGGKSHPVYSIGFSQDVFIRSLQLSFSENGKGVDADIDLFNPNSAIFHPSFWFPSFLLGFILHAFEVLIHKITGGVTSPYRVAYRENWECL